MRVMNCYCAGLDVHQKTVTACTLIGEAGTEPKVDKRVFGTTTRQLLEMSDWLAQQGVTHVATCPQVPGRKTIKRMPSGSPICCGMGC